MGRILTSLLDKGLRVKLAPTDSVPTLARQIAMLKTEPGIWLFKYHINQLHEQFLSPEDMGNRSLRMGKRISAL